MEDTAFEDIDGDLLHFGWMGNPWLPNKYGNTLSVEIEMVTPEATPVLYFNADQLRDLAKKLVEAADFLDKQGV
jgi:hypothetical protein